MVVRSVLKAKWGGGDGGSVGDGYGRDDEDDAGDDGSDDVFLHCPCPIMANASN